MEYVLSYRRNNELILLGTNTLCSRFPVSRFSHHVLHGSNSDCLTRNVINNFKGKTIK